MTCLMVLKLCQRAARTAGLVSAMAAKQRNSLPIALSVRGASWILPVSGSAMVRQTPALGQV